MRSTLHDALHLRDLMRWGCGGRVVSAVAQIEGPGPEVTLTAMIKFETGPLGMER